MKLRPALVELVVSDMAATLAFYRHLGVTIPPDLDGEPHVDVDLGGGLRLAFDTEATIRSFDHEWCPPTGAHRIALAFACDSPAEVDDAYAELTGAGYDAHIAPWDAFWGMRYAVVRDPEREPCRPVRRPTFGVAPPTGQSQSSLTGPAPCDRWAWSA